MIDWYGHSNFKAFTDCGLDLGWSHPNASDFPSWPADDCYHTCNTNCSTSAVATGNGTSGSSGGGSGSKTGSGAMKLNVETAAAAVTILLVAGGALLL